LFTGIIKEYQFFTYSVCVGVCGAYYPSISISLLYRWIFAGRMFTFHTLADVNFKKFRNYFDGVAGNVDCGD
jgi:hypothetical protein